MRAFKLVKPGATIAEGIELQVGSIIVVTDADGDVLSMHSYIWDEVEDGTPISIAADREEDTY